jgi:Carboxypeptidase regulatory-like domain/TonB-dependent Receptor Plug Domain
VIIPNSGTLRSLRSLIGWASALALLAVCVQLNAQTSKGTLAGEVRDPRGAVISNASVTVVSQDTQETRVTATGSTGSFRIEAIDPGTWSIHVDAPGFQSFDAKDLIVRASVITTYNPVIAVGSVTQTVQVEANTNDVNTDNGHLSASIGAKELDQLPIFSLNPVELTATLPGAQYINDTATNAGGSYGQYEHVEFNGARPRANNYMLDGQDINDVGLGGQAFQPQIPDMFQSVTALTNSAPAEYGRAGGAVVNLISKAGTNQFHGTAFELYSGSGLNAVDGITRVGSTSRANKARYDQHQYGFTAGGPLWKNKVFAFGGTQFTRFFGNSTSGQIELPDANGYATLNAIGGPQVALLQSLLDNGSYLAQYQYKASLGVVEQINVGQPTIGNGGACPASGCVITTGFYQRPPVPQQAPDTQWLYRIDFIPHEKDTFTFRYLHDRNNFVPDLSLNTSGIPGFDGEVGGPSELASGNWTHVFSLKLLNEFRVSETRIKFLFQPVPSALANPASKIYNLNFADNNLPVLGLSQNIPQGTGEDGYQFQDTVGWIVGRQSFRLGADVGRILETDIVAQLAVGELNFTAGGGPSGIGNFLNNNLGASGSATKTFGPTRFDPHTWRSAFFAQDDIKMTPGFTLNLGLRWDYLTDPGNALPYPAIDVQDLAAPINTVFKIHTDTLNFGPRIGFAYAPSGGGLLGGGKTVVHGGFGIFYDTSFSNIATNTAQASPNAPTGTLISTQGAGLGNATGLIATIQPQLSPQSSVFSVDKNLVNPRTYQWNLGVERALPAQLKLALNYVASRGRSLFANQQYNYFDSNTGNRLNPDRGAISARANSAASQYDSVQVDVTRQFAKGLFFRAAYTYGNNLDDGSEIFSLFTGPTSYPANLAPGGRAQDWGPAAFDYRQYFTVSYVWSPAGFRAQNRAADLLLGGFTRNFSISGVTQLQSGPPGTFNIGGIDTNGDGSAFNDRPLLGNRRAPLNTAGIDGAYLVGGTPGAYYDLASANSPAGTLLPVTPDQVHWLVPSGGAEITPYEIGRNSYTNPGSTVWNVAAQKDIPVPWAHLEGARFEIRAEAEDVGNHNDVGPLDTNVLHIGSGNTYLNPGNTRIASARNVRFWAKFSF